MIRIGIDARLLAYRDGGISTYIRELALALDDVARDEDITLFQHRKAQTGIGSHFSEKRLWTPPHHRLERLALSAELAPFRLDVLHSPDFIPPYRGAKRHVITVHDLTFLHYPQYLTADARCYYNDQIALACKQADLILAVSDCTKQDLIEMLNVPMSKIRIQPHGVHSRYRVIEGAELEDMRKTLKLPAEFILHVGTYEPRKNILGLAKAYKRLLADLPDAPPIVLVGRPGWLFDKTLAEIDTLGLKDRIVWRSDVTDNQLPYVYNLAAFVTAPSFYEGFGLPLLEAMACGTVPIASNRSSFPEVMGDVGLLFDPEDINAIAEALKKALTDSLWRTEMQAKALERAKLYTWQKSAEIALDAYQSVL
ncbi:MAG: glycosyltransferase family 4 protein [Anaerolineae bacterium]|nr:glycosyltransferase family 4 protein [Anaerolineae bacterium]